MIDPILINKCLDAIEAKLQWGDRKLWNDSDFQNLSDGIFSDSKIRISVPTLKRLFGRKKIYSQSYNPQNETKNALVIFLGYKDWQEYKTGNIEKNNSFSLDQDNRTTGEIENDLISEIQGTIPGKHNDKKKIQQNAMIVFIVAIVAIGVFFVFNSHSNQSFTFKGRFTKGLMPTTAVIDYDISKLRSDSIIVFFGEYNNKLLLSKSNHILTKWYELPCSCQVILMDGKKILKKQNVHILSKGWVSIIFSDDYSLNILMSESFDSLGYKYVPEKVISTYIKKSLMPETLFRRYKIQHRLSKDFGVDGDEFTFVSRVKNNSKIDKHQCNDVTFELQGSKGTIKLQFLNPSCIYWAKEEFGNIILNGEFSDLSAFGVDMTDWRVIKAEVKNKQIKVYIGNKLIYKTQYQESIGEIGAIFCESLYSGSFDYIRFYDKNGKMVFNEDFDGTTEKQFN